MVAPPASSTKTLHRSRERDRNSAMKKFAGRQGPMILFAALYFSLADRSEKKHNLRTFIQIYLCFSVKLTYEEGAPKNKKSPKRAPYTAWPPQKIFPTTPLHACACSDTGEEKLKTWDKSKKLGSLFLFSSLFSSLI